MFQPRPLQSDQIRVLVNAIHSKSGGGVTYLRNVLPLLAKDEDFELHLYLHKDQLELFGVIEEGVQVHVLDFSNGFLATLLWEQCVLPIRARRMSIDVTLSPANYGPLLAPRTIIMLRNSLAVAKRETRLLKRLYWMGLTLMTILSLIKCERAIAVSTYARKVLTFGMEKKFKLKVPVVYHGVNTEFQPLNYIKRQEFLLSVSDIYIQKNIHTLISAFSLVREKNPGLKLKLAGKAIDRGYQAEINEAIYSANLESAVELIGEQTTKKLVHLYQSCALFIFPSTVETFGNPLVEAMACGTPIASSNTAAMPEILGDAATYFDPLDAKDMANTIISILENENERQRLGALALERAKLFSWQKTASQTASIIKSVASSG